MAITSAKELKQQIADLEARKIIQQEGLKEAFGEKLESLRPVNLVKTAFMNLSTSSDLKDGIIDHTLGLAAGLLSNKLLVGSTNNPIKKMIGSAVQLGVAKYVSEHTDVIKGSVISIFNKFFQKKEAKEKPLKKYK